MMELVFPMIFYLVGHTELWKIGRLSLDYKHYLTSAHENYDRLQGHMIELSAGFDL